MPFTPLTSVVAPQVQVRFLTRGCDAIDYRDNILYKKYYVSKFDLRGTQFLPGTGDNSVFPNQFKEFNDTVMASVSTDANGTNSLNNQAAMDMLAQQIATDYSDWITNSFDITYNGSLNIVPVGYYNFILIDMDEDDNWTRVFSPPPTDYPDEMNHYDSSIDYGDRCETYIDPCVYLYGYPARLTQTGMTTINLSLYRLCLEDGRLKCYYIRSDAIDLL